MRLVTQINYTSLLVAALLAIPATPVLAQVPTGCALQDRPLVRIVGTVARDTVRTAAGALVERTIVRDISEATCRPGVEFDLSGQREFDLDVPTSLAFDLSRIVGTRTAVLGEPLPPGFSRGPGVGVLLLRRFEWPIFGEASPLEGRWRVAGAACPATCAVSPDEARAWVGRTGEYRATFTSFDGNTCAAPTYRVAQGDPTYFAHSARVPPDTWGTLEVITVITLLCNGTEWSVPGATVLQVRITETTILWDGLLLTLEQTN